MKCLRCRKNIVGRKENAKYCCVRCARLAAKARWREKYKAETLEYAKRYRKANRPRIAAYNKAHEELAPDRYQLSGRSREWLLKLYPKCVRCSSDTNLQAAHIKPHWSGGRAELANMIIMCAKCHSQFDHATANFWRGAFDN